MSYPFPGKTLRDLGSNPLVVQREQDYTRPNKRDQDFIAAGVSVDARCQRMHRVDNEHGDWGVNDQVRNQERG